MKVAVVKYNAGNIRSVDYALTVSYTHLTLPTN
mgnify:CR=1 FL=1